MKRRFLVLFPIGVILLAAIFWPSILKYQPWAAGPWPAGTVLYYNQSQYDKTLKMAIHTWEKTGLPINFRETDKKSKADLLFLDSKKQLKEECGDCLGHADVGYGWMRGQSRIDLMPSRFNRDHEFVDFYMLPTAIHELGHFLGLKHTDDICSVMNVESACRRLVFRKWTGHGTYALCGPWRADIDRLSDLYETELSLKAPICFDRAQTVDALLGYSG